MAWIYLAESVDSPSPWQIGSSQLPTVKVIDMHSRYYCRECRTGRCQLHPYGMMSGLSEPETFVCASLSTSSMEASRVRTLALQAAEKAWQESEAGYFSRSYGLFAKYDHDSSSWKMSLELLPMGLMKPQRNWPPFGMIVDGKCSQLRASERRIKENAGFVWPTPLARDCRSFKSAKRSPKAQGSEPLTVALGGTPNPTWVEWLMGFPTGWTVLEYWAMQWFRSKPKKRLKDLSDSRGVK